MCVYSVKLEMIKAKLFFSSLYSTVQACNLYMGGVIQVPLTTTHWKTFEFYRLIFYLCWVSSASQQRVL